MKNVITRLIPIIGELKIVEDIFRNLSKQMMEQKYILDLRRLLIIALDLKRYLFQKFKPMKLLILILVTKETHVDAIAMDLHMW